MGNLKGYEEMRKLMSEMDVDKNFRYTHGPVAFGNPVSMYINNMLNEGLVKTYPIETTIKYIKKYFKLDDKAIYPITTENSCEPQIHVTIPDVGDNKELMDKAMNFCGYYCGAYNYISPWLIELQYERKFDEDSTKEIIEGTTYFYHISPSVYEEKIRKNGIAPYHRNKKFNFPERIYLCTDMTMDDLYIDDDILMDLGTMLWNANVSNGGNIQYAAKYTVYQINAKNLPENIKLHKDPNMENAVYTTDNIPPTCFVNIAHMDLDEDKITWEK